MAQIKVFNLDLVCLLSELNPKEAEAINGGAAATYALYKALGRSEESSRRAARNAFIRTFNGRNFLAASAASLSTPD